MVGILSRASAPLSLLWQNFGQLSHCGNALVRFGGPRIPGAQPFPLRRLLATQPIVIRL